MINIKKGKLENKKHIDKNKKTTSTKRISNFLENITIPTNHSKEKIYSIACIILIIDQLTKLLIKTKMSLSSELVVIPNFFSLYYVENEGAAFSILENKTFFLILMSFLCLFLVDRYITKEAKQEKLTILSFGMIIGGMLGNLIDRLLYQKVTDFLSFTFFKYTFATFNIADIGITVGVVILIITILLEELQQRNKNWYKKF